MRLPAKLLLLCVVLASSPFASLASSDHHGLLSNAAVWADVDGDHRLDHVEGRATRQGGAWRVVSTEIEREIAGLPSWATDPVQIFSLRPWDVDHDSDLDLVVRDEFHDRNIGVWINDGSGHFEEGDPEDIPDRQPEVEGIATPNSTDALAVVPNAARRLHPSTAGSAFSVPLSPRSFLSPSQSERSALSSVHLSENPRGPPHV